jgi:Uma2 family endonuclease
MATTATSAMTIEEYLNGPIPEPDVEFVDGELKAKPVVMSIHGRLQTIIGAWFERHAEDWGVLAAVEVRTRVAAGRVRLPDVVVGAAKAWPETLVDPPLIVMEILSPSESFTELSEKLRDCHRMGIPNIWIIDPQTRRAWTSAGAVMTETGKFMVEGTPIYLDLSEMFARYDRFR